ncbi:hypothetical protein P5673_004755 [Acropora cervicornis]|uniref:Uncharacterized protein n=1 Tax=Acropora cervicornis TaxID=6130 RepID=A0AAD9VD66_ACRCE|nr:hypothetical protein P5673_004755 [Acropora cervicornis]
MRNSKMLVHSLFCQMCVYFCSLFLYYLFSLNELLSSRFQVTAVHPVREGQCIALGYESVLPLVLLTLQGGDIKPYKFPNEGTKAIAGSDVEIVFEGIQGKFESEENNSVEEENE